MRVNKSDIYLNHKRRDIVKAIDLKTHLYEVMHCWRATTIGRLIYTVSQKNVPTISAVTRESIVGFS